MTVRAGKHASVDRGFELLLIHLQAYLLAGLFFDQISVAVAGKAFRRPFFWRCLFLFAAQLDPANSKNRTTSLRLRMMYKSRL
jgi:hypothetical protein